MKNYLTIDSVGTYFKLRNYKLLHPLIGILNFDNFEQNTSNLPNYDGFNFECFAIFLKDHKSCKMEYGGKPYDYDEGTMVFIAPHQSVGFKHKKNYRPKGYALLFHNDLLLGTDLGKKINNYSFFSYAVNEALHLSRKERKQVLGVIENIQFELEQNMDKHSRLLMASNIELLLNYCSRFYDRQFLTRHVTNNSTIEKFHILLDNYFISQQQLKIGFPTVSYFADKLHLSTNYFGDMIKKETGKSAKEFIHTKIINLAKEEIFKHKKSISEIAYELGFKYPQHFTRLFKSKVGYSPNKFKLLN